jgi:hypothetical protein
LLIDVTGSAAGPQVARLLLESGADPDLASPLWGGGRGEAATPLMAAAINGELELLRLLLGWGAAVCRIARSERHASELVHSAACPRPAAGEHRAPEQWLPGPGRLGAVKRP